MKKTKVIVGAALAAAVLPFARCSAEAVGPRPFEMLLNFENPVIAEDWPDPTVWDGGDGWRYSVATGLKKLKRSRDLVRWEDAGDPLTPEARRTLTNLTRSVWAPSVTKVGAKWLLYVSLYVTGNDNRIEVLSADRPNGPFEHCGNVIRSQAIRIGNTIDPYVLTVDGRVWMFFGSCMDGIHRVELTADGLAVKPGATPVHVAGRRFSQGAQWGKPGNWEGAYVFRRGDWWYLFASGGYFHNETYHMTVGRAKSVDGTFVDRQGRPMTAAQAEPILRSDKGDRFYGPGHNGDVFSTADGRDWVFFHAHDRTRPRAADRPTLLQEIRWTPDGWPTFEGDKPALKQTLAVGCRGPVS